MTHNQMCYLMPDSLFNNSKKLSFKKDWKCLVTRHHNLYDVWCFLVYNRKEVRFLSRTNDFSCQIIMLCHKLHVYWITSSVLLKEGHFHHTGFWRKLTSFFPFVIIYIIIKWYETKSNCPLQYCQVCPTVTRHEVILQEPIWEQTSSVAS